MKPEIEKVGVVGSNPIARSSFSRIQLPPMSASAVAFVVT